MSECKRIELHERIPELVNGTLGAGAREALEEHLAQCESAREELALVRAAHAAIVRRTPVIDTDAVVAAVRESRARGRSQPAIVVSRAVVWRVAAALAIAATGALGYWLGTHRVIVRRDDVLGSQPPALVPSPLPGGPPVVPVAPPKITPPPAKSLAAGASPKAITITGVADLSDAQTGAILHDLEQGGASFQTEPVPDFDLGSGL